VSENSVIHNANIYGIDLSKIDGLILSHGHFDHFTGLVNIIKRISYSRQASANNIYKKLQKDIFLLTIAVLC
jgi:7,8-dihydropterin-6-yl-methyl-4-(beta-D-ribofuranosyl)aminobenzene 5'-phosphate synthase